MNETAMTNSGVAATTSNEELQAQVDQLRLMVDSLQTQLRTLQHGVAPERVAAPDAEPLGSRRNLLRLAGGAAVVAAAGSVLLDGARPAAADSGESLVGGRGNNVNSMTWIRNGTGANGFAISNSLLTVEKTMFWADNRNSTLTTAVGMRGDGNSAGTGVDGYGGTGVNGSGTTGVRGIGNKIGVLGVAQLAGGIGLAAQGAGAALALSPSTGLAPPDRTDLHAAGEIDIDSGGTTWICVAAGSPGTWRTLGGVNTAGSLHAIDPVRAYDSRWTGGTRLSNTLSKIVSVADGHNSAGAVTAPNAVPAGATAVSYILTVTKTSGSGYLSVTPGGSTSSVSSSINWFGDNQDIANGLIVSLDADRQIKIFGGGGGSTDYVVDITGYFL